MFSCKKNMRMIVANKYAIVSFKILYQKDDIINMN